MAGGPSPIKVVAEKQSPTTRASSPGGGQPSPPRPYHSNLFIYIKGVAPSGSEAINCLSGDVPPAITDGYGQWSVVQRPTRRGVTTFQGYNPTAMTVNVRLGQWDPHSLTWDTSAGAGLQTEQDCATLDWMAGGTQNVGQPPYVYVSTYGVGGNSTNLVPFTYQQTAGVHNSEIDTKQWPWIISNGITWGLSYRNGDMSRVYQEASFVLWNYQNFNNPVKRSSATGHTFKTKAGRDTCLLIARSPSVHSFNVQTVAKQIQQAGQNNPIPHTRISLKNHLLNYHIKHGVDVWVPQHAT